MNFKNIIVSMKPDKMINGMILFTGNFTKTNLIYRDIKQFSCCLWPGELLPHRNTRNFLGQWNCSTSLVVTQVYTFVIVLYLDYSDGYPNVYIFQNSMNCILKNNHILMYVNYTSIQLTCGKIKELYLETRQRGNRRLS